MPDPQLIRWSTLLLVFALSTGCGSLTSQIERGLERELPNLIGPANRYQVDIEGLRARSGEASRVSAVGERVRPEDAPIVNRLDLELRGVKYDRSRDRLERVESARATAHITALDLATFLEEHRNVRDASVTLREPSEATIRVRPEFGGIALPRGIEVEVRGRLVAEDGLVRFDVSEVRAAGASLGRTAARRLSDVINPLVDLSGTDANLQVTDVRVENGTVRLDATGDPTGLRLRQRGS